MSAELAIAAAPAVDSVQEPVLRDYIVPALMRKFQLHPPEQTYSETAPFAYSTGVCVEGVLFSPIEIAWENRTVHIEAQMLQTIGTIGATAHVLAIQTDPSSITLIAGIDIPPEEYAEVEPFSNWAIIGSIETNDVNGQLIFTPGNSIDAADTIPSMLQAGTGTIQVQLFENIHHTRVEPLDFLIFESIE